MSTKNLIIAIASAFGLVGLVYWLTQRNKTATVLSNTLVDPDLDSTSNSCITVAGTATGWTDPGWYDETGINYIKSRIEGRWKEFGLPSKDIAIQYGLAFFKAIDLKPTKPNVQQYEKELIAYLKSDDKFPHWDETVGRRRC